MTKFDLKTEIEIIEANLNVIRDDMLVWKKENPEMVDAAGYVEELAARLREPVLDSGAALFLESIVAQCDQVLHILIQRSSDFPMLMSFAADLESEQARLRGLLKAVQGENE